MAQLIAIEHPDLEQDPHGPARVSQKAFDLIWQLKGWQKVEGSEEEAPVLVLPSGSLDQQIAKAQKALEEGRLKPPADGEGEPPALVATTKVEGEQTPAKKAAAAKADADAAKNQEG